MRSIIYGLLACTMCGNVAADDDLRITPDVVYGHKHGMALTMDVFRPQNGNGVGVLFMVSGGWYSTWMPPENTKTLFEPLLDEGYTVFAVRHGSSPKFVIPEIVEDVRRSVRFVRMRAKDFEVDPERLGVSGGSAGGHLSLVLASTGDDGDPDAKDPVARQSSRVAAAVAYFPPTDLRPYVKQESRYRKQFVALQFDESKAGDFSPLVQVTKDDAPMLMIHGDKDELVPIWHSQKMVSALAAVNIPARLLTIENAAHGFSGNDKKRASEAWIDWLDTHLLNAKKKDEQTDLHRHLDAPTPKKRLFTTSKPILLWDEGAPGAQGTDVTDQPAITVHLPPQELANGAAVIVNPGGGYHVLASDHEGLQVARELNRNGVTAFVLRYRLKPKYSPDDALQDAQRAVRLVRHRAIELGIDANRIGMMGFSAGGHIASRTGTEFDLGDSSMSDPIEHQSCRPDFLVLVYPAISGTLSERLADWHSSETKVSKNTPPTFLVHTHGDSLSPNHSVLFYQALLSKGVSAELHVFANGPHGMGLGFGDPDFGSWPQLLQKWMCRSGFQTAQPRVPIRGTVELNEAPLYWGWITFYPEDKNCPTACAYMHFSKKGVFEIQQSQGPCLGRHQVEIRLITKDFSKPKSGAYSIDDVETISTTKNGKPIWIDITEKNRKNIDIQVQSSAS